VLGRNNRVHVAVPQLDGDPYGVESKAPRLSQQPQVVRLTRSALRNASVRVSLAPDLTDPMVIHRRSGAGLSRLEFSRKKPGWRRIAGAIAPAIALTTHGAFAQSQTPALVVSRIPRKARSACIGAGQPVTTISVSRSGIKAAQARAYIPPPERDVIPDLWMPRRSASSATSAGQSIRRAPRCQVDNP
jgi:hypothetical protein